jgi:DNA-binding transcriptional MocR family regulator
VRGSQDPSCGRRPPGPERPEEAPPLALAAPSPGPLYRRLAAALRAGIQRGDLSPGMRLPPERHLAAAAGVGRSTVVAAYDLLREDGLVERRQGSGTRVRAGAVSGASRSREVELTQALQANALFRGVIEGVDGGIDFLGAHPGGTPLLTRELLAGVSAELLEAGVGHGGRPARDGAAGGPGRRPGRRRADA